MAKKIVDLQRELRNKKKAYHEKSEKMTVAEARELSDEIRGLVDGLSAAITAGANPCPFCKSPLTGIAHQGKRAGSFEYEVGCIACPPFQHSDGTMRRPAARGGMLARHTVELWNEGPDHWIVAKPQTEFATPIIGRVDDAPATVDEGDAP